MSGRDPTGYARRNRVPLALLFAGFVLFGLMRENGAALLGGLGGLAWVALASWGRR
jgi:hypothetical protein